MNDRFTFDDSSLNLDAFQEWVTRTAENEGTTPSTIIQRLMSTYWILNELTETLEETPYDHLLEQEGDTPASVEDVSTGAEAEADGSSSMDDVVDVIKAIAEINDRSELREPPQPQTTIDPQVVDIIEALQRQPSPAQLPSADPAATHHTGRLEEFRSELAGLERTLETVDDRVNDVEGVTDQHVEEAADRFDRIETRADELEEQLQSVSELSESTLSELEAEIQTLTETIQDKADRAAVAKLEAETDREFDAIERAFERLLESIADTDSELDDVADSLGRDTEEFRQYHREQRRLGTLTREAMREGIRDAVCDNCEQSVDLALLSSPFCPNCDRTLSSIESGGWNPLKKPRVTTEPIRSTATVDENE